LQTAQKTALQNLLSKTTDDRRRKELSAALQEIESTSPTSSAEKEVRKLERQWLDAYEHDDADAMARMLADEFTITFGDGRTQNRTEVLESVKAHGSRGGGPAPKFATEHVEARVEDDHVVLTGRLLQTSERNGETKTMRFNYTDTYQLRDGRWQAVNSRLTRL
jgi:ketosteroid isomerase-like protein